MDADPWADAPPSPRPQTPSSNVVSPSHPSYPVISSPLAGVSVSHSQSPSSPLASSDSTANDHPIAQPQESNIEIEEGSDAVEASGGDKDVIEGAEGDVNGNDGFDDFDDFDEPAAGPSSPQPGDDDGFGDFGDFEEGEFGDVQDVQDVPANQKVMVSEPDPTEQPWQALKLRPMPSVPELLEQLSNLLSPLTTTSSGSLMEEPPRQTGGLNQVMVTESSREAYAQLTTPPMLKSLDWTRSRVRREHLISMGVPVNLDEVDSHRISSLPPLRIVTNTSMPPPPVPLRSSSVDAGPRFTAQQKGKGKDDGTNGTGIQNVPLNANVSQTNGDGGQEKYGLGPRPVLDVAKAEELCGIEEDQLSLLSLERLANMQDKLVETSSQASALLAWLLQLKDAQTQDSQTYNGMISELIANAAKAKSAQTAGSGGVFKRNSVRQPRRQSPSGTITPRRVASPMPR